MTTAFLTPAFRNRNVPLTPGLVMVGRPERLYQATLEVLSDIQADKLTAEDVLAEVTRQLLLLREEQLLRTEGILNQLRTSEGVTLSAETIVTLIEQHLKCPNSSRLPVLVVAAAYKAAEEHLKEHVLPLTPHNAADRRTGALGDLQICLLGDSRITTVYEMKTRRVTPSDLEIALQKVASLGHRIDKYIFITTEEITPQVHQYAISLYKRTGGIEFAILDCISFIRHFLHLFHHLRNNFLDIYQQLLLEEPESSVRQELKEAFLALRLAAVSSNGIGGDEGN
jgi:hypothetical protein